MWGDVEAGDWKRLVNALPSFLCLAPDGLKTIYTATEEAPQSLLHRYTSRATLASCRLVSQTPKSAYNIKLFIWGSLKTDTRLVEPTLLKLTGLIVNLPPNMSNNEMYCRMREAGSAPVVPLRTWPDCCPTQVQILMGWQIFNGTLEKHSFILHEGDAVRYMYTHYCKETEPLCLSLAVDAQCCILLISCTFII